MTDKRLGCGNLTISKIRTGDGTIYFTGFVQTHKGKAVIAAEETENSIRLVSYLWTGHSRNEMGQAMLERNPKFDGRRRVAMYVGELEIDSFPFRVEMYKKRRADSGEIFYRAIFR